MHEGPTKNRLGELGSLYKYYYYYCYYYYYYYYSLHRRRNLTLVSNHGNVCEAATISLIVLGPQRTQQETGSAFRISFHPDWQIDNGLFNRPIMTRTQILKHTGDPEQGFQCCFTD